VDDIAHGTITALQYLEENTSAPIFEIINLGSDRPVALIDVIRQVEKLVGKRACLEHRPRHSADVPATWADISKARKLLNWEPRTSFEEGLRQAVVWYRENRSWAAQVDTGNGRDIIC
jgi:nucleoside-diphosphate-sugar epimerase